MKVLYCQRCDKRKMYEDNEKFCSVCGLELTIKARVGVNNLMFRHASETPQGLQKALLLTSEQAERLKELLENMRFDVVVTEESAWITAVNGRTLEEL